MSLIKNLLQLKKKNITFFTTPSHSGHEPFKSMPGEKYYSIDFSEVDELDNLCNPKSCILEWETKLKDIYGSGFSRVLTNGSTQGILALMTAALRPGDKVIVSANCHKSVYNGLILTGANCVWVYPEFNSEFGIYTRLNAQQVLNTLNANPDTKCVIITNPTYDGVISDTKKIADICKERGVILIADEAHGALWNFDKTLGTPAILCGADASVQSLHKTGGAVTPAAIVHLSVNSRISKSRLEKALNVISTTSPSFAIMANIEETVDFLHSKKGRRELEKLTASISQLRRNIKTLEHFELFDLNADITKILLHPKRLSAQEVSEILYSKFKIECEIQHERSLTFLCGLGTSEKKLKKLWHALKYVNKISKKREEISFEDIIPPERQAIIDARTAFNSEYEEILPNEAEGKICAQIITTYPPGIPVLSYGERITAEHIKFLNPNTKIRIVK